MLEHMKKFNVCPMLYKGDYMYVNDVYDCMVTDGDESLNIIKYESRNCNL
ncbi:MAG: hypothetical protein ACLUTA_15170 [Blautia wexlerae]